MFCSQIGWNQDVLYTISVSGQHQENWWELSRVPWLQQLFREEGTIHTFGCGPKNPEINCRLFKKEQSMNHTQYSSTNHSWNKLWFSIGVCNLCLSRYFRLKLLTISQHWFHWPGVLGVDSPITSGGLIFPISALCAHILLGSSATSGSQKTVFSRHCICLGKNSPLWWWYGIKCWLSNSIWLWVSHDY